MNAPTNRLFRTLPAILGWALLCGTTAPHAQTGPQTIDHVPTTLSPEAQAAMRKVNVVDWEARRAPAPDDLAGWKRLRDAQLAAQIGPGEQVAAREQVSLKDMTLGGVPVLEIRPKVVKDTRRVIVYTHGGAYTMSSARSRLLAMPALANATGMRIVSVDYTTAPAEFIVSRLR
jgi:monoterpene epsilon-lactone hydrolase